MAEGIEFTVDFNGKFDDLINASQALKRTEQAVHGADKAFHHAEHEAGAFGKTLERVKDNIKDFGYEALSTFAGIASFEGIKEIGEGILDMGIEALKAAGDMEQTRKSFEMLLGADEGKEQLEWMERFSKHTEFTGKQIRSLGGEMIRAGFAGEDFRKAMADAVDLSTMGDAGHHFEAALGAAQLLEKVNLRGSIMGRDLRAAGIKEKPFFSQLAKDMGIGVKEVEKRLTEGKIKTSFLMDEVRAAIQKKTGKAGGGAAEDMGQTFLGRLNHMTEISEKLFEKLDNSAGLKGLGDAMEKIGSALDPDSPSGKKIVGGLTMILDKFGQFAANTDFERGISVGLKAVEVFGQALGVAVQVFDQMGTVITGTGMKFSELFQVVGVFPDAVAEIEGWGKKVIDELKALPGQIKDEALHIGASLWEGLTEGIGSGVGSVVNKAGSLAHAAIGTVKGLLDSHSPSKVFADIGMDTAKGFSIGLDSGGSHVEASAQEVFAPASLYSPSSGAGDGGGGRGAVTLNADIQINVGGGGGGAHEIADATAVSVRQAMQSVLERFRAEVGA